MSDEEITINRGEGSLTYSAWYDHVKDLFTGHWKTLVIYTIGGFGVFWGLIEAGSFFFPDAGLAIDSVLWLGVLISFLCALVRCIFDYRNTVPSPLVDENKKIRDIFIGRKHFWEYALSYELLKKDIEKIDQDINDLANNRIHVKITKSMDIEEYIHWLETRPDNLLGLVASAKQLLVFDIASAIHNEDDNVEAYLKNLIRILDLTRNLYRTAYDFEVEGRQIKIPSEFELLHEIQYEWVSVIQDAFKQMLEVLHSISLRNSDDMDPIEAEIIFEEPPRIEEFCDEMSKIEDKIKYGS